MTAHPQEPERVEDELNRTQSLVRPADASDQAAMAPSQHSLAHSVEAEVEVVAKVSCLFHEAEDSGPFHDAEDSCPSHEAEDSCPSHGVDVGVSFIFHGSDFEVFATRFIILI